MSELKKTILILGVGNNLLSDDGFGIHVIESLRDAHEIENNSILIDGGTIGLNLLPDIEDAEHLIVVDAAEMGLEPGELRLFEGEDMDDHLSKHKTTVHEVAMRDLLFAARLSGKMPKTRALIAVQPASLDWGMNPTPVVMPSVSKACEMVKNLVERRLVDDKHTLIMS
ncbi:HyaD/HybD family hydrogenase maturation endopeptidase [Pseudaquidulcibacter saccharophilus]|uniref:HyaD/HybD family hydrogenase maturation endopeptidase n=1 Tax=Pseudaquidulcibacter saccharophilus TaxID=2831900 RepID=UPI001EFF47B7|nr:HyaD/HybD family hydrogenase maturation endopeptidase [Pseudaquidulcibacter saccharophilus]